MKKIGRYEVIEELGRGAMGVVFKASDPTIGRMVAVKVLTLDDKVEEGTLSPRETFLREARAAGRLSHPGIVTIHDALEDESTRSSYIVMEFIPGKTLEKILISSPRIETEKTFDIIRQVADALDYAHRNQIIHRDLKPANIILTEDGRAKITDFGIAKIMAQGAMRTMSIMGTPSYMSPEQVTGGEIDARADIFSLGILIYLMLVGEKPFAGDTAAVMFKIVYEDPVTPSKINPKLTSADDYVVLRCLAKDRAKRYSSARELLDDLEDLRQGRTPRSMAYVSPSEIQAAERTVAAAHPFIPLVPPTAAQAPPPTAPPAAPAAVTARPVSSAAPLSPSPVASEPPKPPTATPIPHSLAGIVATPTTAPAAHVAKAAVEMTPPPAAEKKSSSTISVALGLIALLAIGGGIWYSHGPSAPVPQPVQEVAAPTQPTTEPAPVVVPLATKEAAVTPPKVTPKPTNSRVKNSPAISAPAPALPQPAPPSPPVAGAAKTSAVPAAASLNEFTVNCKHEFDQATLLMTERGKMVYQARLVGEKKKGFIGIGGKGFGGQLTESVSIPNSIQQLTVRIYSDDGTINLQNTVAAHPPSGEATVLNISPSKDHLKLEWTKPRK